MVRFRDTRLFHGDITAERRAASFEHLVGERKQRMRHRKSHLLESFQIDDAFEIVRLADRNIGSCSRPACPRKILST